MRSAVQHRTVEDRTIVEIPGELDFACLGGVRADLERVLADAPGPVVLDLSRTTFVDSAGINLIFEAHTAMRSRNAGFGLVVPPDSLIHRTLSLTGVGQTMPIHATLEDALSGDAEPTRERRV